MNHNLFERHDECHFANSNLINGIRIIEKMLWYKTFEDALESTY